MSIKNPARMNHNSRIVILRSREAASRRVGSKFESVRLSWFETREDALLTMRNDLHTFSNGNSMSLRFSSQVGTGRFFERMNSGLNSFD